MQVAQAKGLVASTLSRIGPYRERVAAPASRVRANGCRRKEPQPTAAVSRRALSARRSRMRAAITSIPAVFWPPRGRMTSA